MIKFNNTDFLKHTPRLGFDGDVKNPVTDSRVDPDHSSPEPIHYAAMAGTSRKNKLVESTETLSILMI